MPKPTPKSTPPQSDRQWTGAEKLRVVQEAVSTGAAFSTTPNSRAITACAQFSSADMILQDAQFYAELESFRITHGVPAYNADSAQFYNVAAACDSAEIAYLNWRVSQGDPNMVIPVDLVRLGGTGFFLGTSLIARDGQGREYVVFDSTFTVKAVFGFV